jgi:MFS family permease
VSAPTPSDPEARDLGSRNIDRRALQSVAVQFFANGLVYATFIPRLPEIRDRVGISIGALGIVLMLGSISGLVASVFAGRVIARFGSRRVMIFGAMLSIGSLPIIGLATTPIMLIVGLVGVLFFDVFIDVAMNVQASALSARRHAPVINRLHGLWSFGTVAGGAATVVLIRADVSAPQQFLAVAMGLIVALVFVAPGLLRRDEVPELAPARAEGESTIEELEKIVRHPLSLFSVLLGAGGAAAMLIEATNGDWATFRLGDDLGALPGVAGVGFLAYAVGMTAGRFGGDSLQVRLGRVRLIRVAAIVSGIGSAVATLVPNIAVAIVGFLVVGLGSSVLFPQLYDRAARAPGPPGSGFASMLIGTRSAAILAPLIVGSLASTAVFDVGPAMAIVLLPSAVIVFLITLAPAD